MNKTEKTYVGAFYVNSVVHCAPHSGKLPINEKGYQYLSADALAIEPAHKELYQRKQENCRHTCKRFPFGKRTVLELQHKFVGFRFDKTLEGRMIFVEYRVITEHLLEEMTLDIVSIIGETDCEAEKKRIFGEGTIPKRFTPEGENKEYEYGDWLKTEYEMCLEQNEEAPYIK